MHKYVWLELLIHVSGNNTRLKTIASAAGWSTAGVLISKVLSYLYRAIIARGAGPEVYGQLSQALAVFGLVVALCAFSIEQVMQRFVPEYVENSDYAGLKGAVVSALQIVVPLSVLGSVILFLYAEPIAQFAFSSPRIGAAIKVLAFVPPFAVVSKVAVETTVGFSEVKYGVIVNQVFQNLVNVAAAAGLILSGFGLFAATGSFLLGHILSSVLALYLMEFKTGPILRRDSSSRMQREKIIRFAYPLLFSSMIGSVLASTDTVFLGYFMDDAPVGIYNVAVPTAALLHLPTKSYGRLVLPSLSAAKTKPSEDRASLTRTLTRWSAISTFPVFVLMALFAGPILNLLWGSQYTAAATVLVVLVLGEIVGEMTGPVNQLLQSDDRTKLVMKNSLGHLALNVVLNILLVPSFGLLGAAVATTVSVIAIDAVLVYEVQSKVGINPYSWDLAKPVVASIPGALLVWMGLNLVFDTVPTWSMIPGAAVYAASYLVILVVTGAFKPEDADIIESGFRRLGRPDLGGKVAEVLVR
jgi:O-antigen/teichoic acid export membrane protein